MFEKLKAIMGSKPTPKSQVDQIPIMKLKNRPFALALMMRAAEEVDWSKGDLDALVGKSTPVHVPATIEEQIDSAICVVAMMILESAAEEAGCKHTYLPAEPLPKEAPMVMAFGFFLIMGMVNPLAAEGYKFEFPKACAQLSSAMLLMYTDEERIKAHKAAVAIFQNVAGARDRPNVKGWIDNTTQLVMYYVEQFTSPVPKIKEMTYLPLFGSQLKVLLSTQE